jgi:hypothetical protein
MLHMMSGLRHPCILGCFFPVCLQPPQSAFGGKQSLHFPPLYWHAMLNLIGGGGLHMLYLPSLLDLSCGHIVKCYKYEALTRPAWRRSSASTCLHICVKLPSLAGPWTPQVRAPPPQGHHTLALCQYTTNKAVHIQCVSNAPFGSLTHVS